MLIQTDTYALYYMSTRMVKHSKTRNAGKRNIDVQKASIHDLKCKATDHSKNHAHFKPHALQ